MTGRTDRRRVPWGLVVVAVGLLAASTGRMPAAPEGPSDSGVGDGRHPDGVYPMVFPLLGEHTLTDSFGDPRGRDRRHEGVDLLADRMVPVVAVADGVVRWVHDERGGNCCDVGVLHDDGWRSRYIHLNNDTPGTDDGRAVGIAPGIREGARVQAGQLIGWVGDSGNAESTVPHLHFELRRPDGTPVDPLPSLKAALRTGRQLAPARPPEGDRAEEGDGEERRGGLWRWLLGRGRGDDQDERERPEGGEDPPNEGRRDRSQTEEETREEAREEALRRTPPPRGDRSLPAEPEVAPAPPMPPEEGEPVEPPEEDGPPTLDGTATPGLPSAEPIRPAQPRPGALPGLGMDRRVEEVPVEVPVQAPAQERNGERSGGALSCFGFAGGSETATDDEP